MIYRLLNPDEIIQEGDECLDLFAGAWWAAIKEGEKADRRIYRRPIRPIEDLTDEELKQIDTAYSLLDREGWADLKGMLRKSDELRSKPKETEKERWINTKCAERCYVHNGKIADDLRETWDAAYEAGRNGK